MNDKELREKTKHRTFTSMAQRRRWLALQNDVEKNEKKEKKDKETPWQVPIYIVYFSELSETYKRKESRMKTLGLSSKVKVSQGVGTVSKITSVGVTIETDKGETVVLTLKEAEGLEVLEVWKSKLSLLSGVS